MSTPDSPKIWPDATGKIDLNVAVKQGGISREVYDREMRWHDAAIGDLATNSQVEAPRDTAEVDPEAVPMYAASWLSTLSPENGKAVFGLEYYDPISTHRSKHREYWPADVAEEERIPGRAYDLMHDRDFARTGKIPAAADANADARAVSTFYKSIHREMGITADPKKNVGMTLVRTDGYSLLSLGIDITGEDRSPVAFAAKGELSTEEMLRRAHVVFSEVFKRIEEAGITLGETPREVVDLPSAS